VISLDSMRESIQDRLDGVRSWSADHRPSLEGLRDHAEDLQARWAELPGRGRRTAAATGLATMAMTSIVTFLVLGGGGAAQSPATRLTVRPATTTTLGSGAPVSELAPPDAPTTEETPGPLPEPPPGSPPPSALDPANPSDPDPGDPATLDRPPPSDTPFAPQPGPSPTDPTGAPPPPPPPPPPAATTTTAPKTCKTHPNLPRCTTTTTPTTRPKPPPTTAPPPTDPPPTDPPPTDPPPAQ